MPIIILLCRIMYYYKRIKRNLIFQCFYKTISNQDDADLLQDNLQEWIDNWQINFNANKCYHLSMHGKCDPTLYRLKGEELVKTSHHPYR